MQHLRIGYGALIKLRSRQRMNVAMKHRQTLIVDGRRDPLDCLGSLRRRSARDYGETKCEAKSRNDS